MGLANVSLLQEVASSLMCKQKSGPGSRSRLWVLPWMPFGRQLPSLSPLFKGMPSPMTACTFSLKQKLCECFWTSENDNMPVSNQLSNDGVRQSAQGPQRISGMAGILIKTSEWLSVPMLECLVIKKKKNAYTQGGPVSPHFRSYSFSARCTFPPSEASMLQSEWHFQALPDSY